MDKLNMHTVDAVDKNIEKIGRLFPNCLTERINSNGKLEQAIDFDKLRQELSKEIVEGREERYQFTWPDKKKAMLLANSPINATLRPCREESVDFDNTENLYIEGDNLDVLKCLKETYLGKIKMIYIDPPYNTGNDFVYEDDFAETSAAYLANSGQFDEQGNRLVTNSESNGRFHTDWLNMIYPRLKVARDLLTDDGAIFISIGDDEEANLIKICDEIFGETNFIASICHKHRASVSNDRIISENHNHILFYSKNSSVLFENQKLIGDDPKLEGFKYKDEKGEYKLTPVDGPGGAKKGNPYYEILGVEGYWRYSKETMLNKINEGVIVRTESSLQQKYYLEQAKLSRQTVTTWWDNDFLTSNATKDLAKLLGGKYFDNPKSTRLILRLLKMLTKFDANAVILDFFSGSATSAHAVMQLNAEDRGYRKYILVQLPEQTDEDSEAYKAGYKNICEIGKERIRRAGKKILEEMASKQTNDDLFSSQNEETEFNLDTGFRVLKLDSSNMEDVYYSPSEYDQNSLFAITENVKSDRTSEDLLFQVMLELGATLDSKIERTEVAGKRIYNVAESYLVACFDTEVSDEVVKAIAKMEPQYAVFRDCCMVDDSTATNFEQIFKTYSPSTTTKVL